MDSRTESANTTIVSKNFDKYYELVEEMFLAAGIKLNGNKSYDIQVKDNRFARKVFAEGPLGFGDSYVAGWWECEDIATMTERFLRADLQNKFHKKLKFIYYFLKLKLINQGRKSKAFEIGSSHYDFGNDLFKAFLDKRMIYSCAYWKDSNDLDTAQEKKLRLICQKLLLKPNMKVLDIGCGWGGFAKYACDNFGVKVVGITVSKEQVNLAQQVCAGLPIEIRLQDYRDLNEKFDAITSIGMFEHVCHPNYRTFMSIVHRCLNDNGLFLLHTIGSNYKVNKTDTAWLDKYIFPNSELPTIKEIGASIEKLFVMEDWQNFGTDYQKTLLSWYQNFVENWDKIKNKYGERFFRFWKYYLHLSMGAFQARYAQLWQIVLSKKGLQDGYQKYIDYHFNH